MPKQQRFSFVLLQKVSEQVLLFTFGLHYLSSKEEIFLYSVGVEISQFIRKFVYQYYGYALATIFC